MLLEKCFKLGNIYPNHQLIITHKINLLTFAKQFQKVPVDFIISFCLMARANFSGNIFVKLCKLIEPGSCIRKAWNDPSRSSLKTSSHLRALDKERRKERKE